MTSDHAHVDRMKTFNKLSKRMRRSLVSIMQEPKPKGGKPDKDKDKDNKVVITPLKPRPTPEGMNW